jgi:iron complex outermembrane receptor protein
VAIINIRLPATFENGVDGETYGIELAAAWQITDHNRLDLAYSYIETDIEWLNPFNLAQNTAAPRHQLSLRSSSTLRHDLDLDIWLRYVGEIDVINTSLDVNETRIDDYLTLDVRLAWRPLTDLELSLVGQIC